MPRFDVDFEALDVGYVVTNQGLAWKVVDEMEFSCDLAEMAVFTEIAGEVDVKDGVFVG